MAPDITVQRVGSGVLGGNGFLDTVYSAIHPFTWSFHPVPVYGGVVWGNVAHESQGVEF